MRRSLIISGIAHTVVLGWGLIAFAARPNDAPPTEPLPVEFISSKDYTDLTAGARNAPKPLPNAKPLADKVDAPKPVKELAPKVADKPEVVTDVHTSAPPKPEPKPVEKPKEAKAKPEPSKPDLVKPDQIADELKKEDAKKDETKKAAKPEKKPPEFRPDQIAEELKRDEAKKPRVAKFDADQVAALLDKREPQRQIASAETPNNAASLGAPTGHAAQLSVSEMDALRRRLSECWNPPPGIDVNSNFYVVLHVLFKPDGSLASEPAVVEDTASSFGPALAESGKRALLGCQPFTMLKPEHYDAWKEIMIGFNPHELLGQ